jgi:uncharacterized damage-inducible protein DinB
VAKRASKKTKTVKRSAAKPSRTVKAAVSKRSGAKKPARAKQSAARGPAVTLTSLFLSELDREGPLTKRALERVPVGRDDWKPHAKSMPLGRLASLVAMMPGWITMMIERDDFDLNPPGGSSGQGQFSYQARTPSELLKMVDEGVAGAKKALQQTTDAHLMKPWRLLVAGKVVAEHPRHVMLRDSINHLAHHRGQLTVYLRLNDVQVPAIYGPSADDQRFN